MQNIIEISTVSLNFKSLEPVKESKSEFKKIVWPAKKQIINNSIVVIIGILVCGLLVSVIDFLFTNGIGFIIGLF